MSRGASAMSRLKQVVLQHFAHHAEIVAGVRSAESDVEFAIVLFAEALGPGDDQPGTDLHVRALDMAVVVNLNAPRRPRQGESLRQRPQQFLLR